MFVDANELLFAAVVGARDSHLPSVCVADVPDDRPTDRRIEPASERRFGQLSTVRAT
jgi:hypothetical protein